jgi:hypothetical protein
MEYGVEMISCGMMYIKSFIKIDAGVQATLMFNLRNLTGCNIGITDGKEL